ncbi:MAG: hypothetical protein NTV22_08975 [bacterium]|nr:hypothetical protein [bacterium]
MLQKKLTKSKGVKEQLQSNWFCSATKKQLLPAPCLIYSFTLCYTGFAFLLRAFVANSSAAALNPAVGGTPNSPEPLMNFEF